MRETGEETHLNPDGSNSWTNNPVRGRCPVGCSYCCALRTIPHEDIRFYPEELDAIRNHKEPIGIFIGSTMDLFHDETIQYMDEIMDTVRACPQHNVSVLTKCYWNLQQFSPFPPNCQVGVSITTPEMARPGLEYLSNIQAGAKFVSFAPLLDNPFKNDGQLKTMLTEVVNWVNIGGCLGTKTLMLEMHDRYPLLTLIPCGGKWGLMPKEEWVDEIVGACNENGIRVLYHKEILERKISPRRA